MSPMGLEYMEDDAVKCKLSNLQRVDIVVLHCPSTVILKSGLESERSCRRGDWTYSPPQVTWGLRHVGNGWDGTAENEVDPVEVVVKDMAHAQARLRSFLDHCSKNKIKRDGARPSSRHPQEAFLEGEGTEEELGVNPCWHYNVIEAHLDGLVKEKTTICGLFASLGMEPTDETWEVAARGMNTGMYQKDNGSQQRDVGGCIVPLEYCRERLKRVWEDEAQ
ncbi:unnamed protein product [Discosporangium mesarthrocarpum]